MANETWKFVQAKSKQAMKQVLGIRDEKARMTVTPPLAMAPVTQEDDTEPTTQDTASRRAGQTWNSTPSTSPPWGATAAERAPR